MTQPAVLPDLPDNITAPDNMSANLSLSQRLLPTVQVGPCCSLQPVRSPAWQVFTAPQSYCSLKAITAV